MTHFHSHELCIFPWWMSEDVKKRPISQCLGKWYKRFLDPPRWSGQGPKCNGFFPDTNNILPPSAVIICPVVSYIILFTNRQKNKKRRWKHHLPGGGNELPYKLLSKWWYVLCDAGPQLKLNFLQARAEKHGWWHLSNSLRLDKVSPESCRTT